MAGPIKAVTKFFLDRAHVQRKVNQGNLRVLSKFGAFVRRSAKSSIRKAKKSAQPGQPPKSHRGDLKRLIFFGLDGAHSVSIGPVIFARSRSQSRMAQEALEYGGTVTRMVAIRQRKTGRQATGRQGAAYRKLLKEGRIAKPEVIFQPKTFRYRGNQFMRPAFGKELTGKLKPLLKDFIQGP